MLEKIELKKENANFWHVYLKKAKFTKTGKESVLSECIQMFPQKSFERIVKSLPSAGYTQVVIAVSPKKYKAVLEQDAISAKIATLKNKIEIAENAEARKKEVLSTLTDIEVTKNSITTLTAQLEEATKIVTEAGAKATKAQKDDVKAKELSLSNALEEIKKESALKKELQELNEKGDAKELHAEILSLEDKFDALNEVMEQSEQEVNALQKEVDAIIEKVYNN